MSDVPRLDKLLYTLPEVAAVTRRPPGLVRRWVHRRQLAVVWLEDGTPCVPVSALRERLARPRRIERVLRDRARTDGDAATETADGARGRGSAGR